MKKILMLFIISTQIILNAQTNQVNLEKYWHYRYRLVNYFLQVGPNDGESVPVAIRNKFDLTVQQRQLYYGDVGRYWAQYVGMLATEYALLKANGQDLNETIRELYYALKVMYRMDENAEEAYGLPPSINGCVARFDTPGNFVATHSGSGIEFKDLNYQLSNCTVPSVCLHIPGSGQPGYVLDASIDEVDYKAVISQDHFSQMLIGYAMVKKFVDSGYLSFNTLDDAGGGDLVGMAKDQVGKIINRALVNNWRYRYPNGDDVENEWGGDWFVYSWGHAKAAQYITEIDYTTNVTNFWKNRWQDYQYDNTAYGCQAMLNNSNLLILLGLAAVGDSWHDENDVNTTPQAISDYGDHGAGYCTLDDVIFPFEANHYGWDLYYGAINALLHDKYINTNDLCRMQQILNTAPWDGPFCHNQNDVAPFDWAGNIRFNESPPIQTTGNPEGGFATFGGNYPGLDYMFFHNLYYLLHAGSNTLSGYYPNDNIPFFGIQGSTINPKIFGGSKQIFLNNLTVSNYFDNNFPNPNEYFGDVQVYGGLQGVTITNTEVNNGGNLFVTANEIPCEVNPNDFIFNSNWYNRVLPPFLKPEEINLGLQFSVYPNPSSGEFILSTSAQNFTVAIYDLLGNLIQEYKNEKNINLSTQSKGIYFLKLTVNGIIYSQKLIIQ